jgi:hypothetical protein
MSKGTSGMLSEALHLVAPRAASLPLGDAKVDAESVREKEREREMEHLTEEDKDILARAKAIEQRHSRRSESALEYDRFLTPRMEESEFRRGADVGVGVGVGMGREGGGCHALGGGAGGPHSSLSPGPLRSRVAEDASPEKVFPFFFSPSLCFA